MTSATARLSIALLLALYFVAGMSSRFFFGENEERAFLVFSWSLYSRVPAAFTEEYAVRVYSVEGMPLDTPVFLDDTKGFLFTDVIDYHHTLVHEVNRLGEAIENDDIDGARQARLALEAYFLRQSVDYEVTRIAYDTIERWKTGTIREAHPLARYTSGHE